ncbi:MAG TPA: ShlB/FhaC/HecB family hemolysin secretion/activation protein [Ramlibacter sp.]|nr:ShlB/FhaC/HecB family hemolysin secretion/activation protein [Ramlibacter sp.]
MNKKTWVALATAMACALPSLAQQVRPDAGRLLDSERAVPPVPAPGGPPTTVVPQPPAAAPTNDNLRVTPAAFRVRGSTLFPESVLAALLDSLRDQPTDMEGLVKAAQTVRRYYRERGYLLTEAYLPEQQFPVTGGAIVIQVLEARVGKVQVRMEDPGVSESLANRIVHSHLKPGDHITEYALDKPILLLRDQVGFEATAAVEPGANTGEADITVIVKSAGPKLDGQLSLDNFGARSAGRIRAVGQANWNNPTGAGDVLNLRGQLSDQSDTRLYRIGYSRPFGGGATKLGLAVARTEYALGRQFAALGATGEGTIYSVSLTQPFVRSRARNVLGALTLERKDLNDRTTTPVQNAERRVDSVRASLLGNFVDEALGASFNSYALNVTFGEAKFDPTTLAQDLGATGLRQSGSFNKVNLEALRTTFLSAASRITLTFQGQLASKNLTSAEKLDVGGVAGVRGYPIGEAVGDSGAVLNVEYRLQLPEVAKVPLGLSVFYDWGHVRYNEAGTPFPSIASETLSSAGFGVTVGTFGNYLLTTQLAWRLDRPPASEPDRRPRVWLSLQKWL